SVIIPVAALTYPVAIVLPKSDRNARSLMKLSFFLTLTIAMLTTILLVFFHKEIVKVFHISKIGPFLYLIPITIVFAGLMQIIQQWLIRTNQFYITAKVNFLQSVIINGSKVGIGLAYPTAVVLILLQVASNGLKTLMMSLFLKKHDYTNLNQEEKPLTIKELIKKYKDFPLYRAP